MNRNTYPPKKLVHTEFCLYQENPQEYRSGDLICTRVAGVTFDNRQDVMAELTRGETIRLCCEPENPYDSNAIRVERLNGQTMGYLNRAMAANLAPFFKAHPKYVRGEVHSLIGALGHGFSLGVIITFYIPGGEKR